MVRWLLALCLLCLGATGCSATEQQTLTVFAGSSLQEPFEALAERLETANPGVEVRFHFAGSATLVEQLRQGARADVLAAADEATMARAAEEDLLTATPHVFATNSLVIAVAPGNPRGIRGFSDLTRDDLKVVVCAPIVPCGAATARVEQRAGVGLRPASEELSVTDVLTKVDTGQADAGVVYVSDLGRAEGRVAGVPIPAAVNATNAYPIATTSESPLAASFVALVEGSVGAEVLQRSGFGSPAPGGQDR